MNAIFEKSYSDRRKKNLTPICKYKFFGITYLRKEGDIDHEYLYRLFGIPILFKEINP